MKFLHCIILFICVQICIMRFACPHVVPSFWGTYEAMAHVFCGYLLGRWFAVGDRLCLVSLIVITSVETVAFFVTK